MKRVSADRVKETSTSTGTGAFTMTGAAPGFIQFSAIPGIAVNDTLYYCIQAVDASNTPTGEWEVGLGTYSAANTLTRTTVLASSNSASLVNFSAGGKQVSLVLPSAQAEWSRERLTADRNYYVRTDGADTNTGLANTAGAAFKTIQYAVDHVAKNLDCNGYTIRIYVADGTYSAGCSLPYIHGGGKLYIIGASIGNTIVTVASGDAFTSAARGNPCDLYVWTMTTNADAGAQIKAVDGCRVWFNNISFGGGNAGSGFTLYATNGAFVQFDSAGPTTTCKIRGGTANFVYAGAYGAVFFSGITFTVTAASTFTTFVNAAQMGRVFSVSCSWSGSAVSGTRYSVTLNAICSGGSGSTTYFPGSVAGSTATGGVYY